MDQLKNLRQGVSKKPRKFNLLHSQEAVSLQYRFLGAKSRVRRYSGVRVRPRLSLAERPAYLEDTALSARLRPKNTYLREVNRRGGKTDS